ncbi:hypothetical protein BTN50_1878 [Candidatus Enterovibrio altilux]|uniref:Uncharacterized protein n=1 Tax=Candidatus Enterovibrio altilux TaxID=1927128 RepID=A0A291BBA5_9GAMM|nr:hypothetical protein BTN50_1878 [Candidatus Enterovibrio luxaltus]
MIGRDIELLRSQCFDYRDSRMIKALNKLTGLGMPRIKEIV